MVLTGALRTAWAAAAVAAALALAGCGAGGQASPFADGPATEDQAGGAAITSPGVVNGTDVAPDPGAPQLDTGTPPDGSAGEPTVLPTAEPTPTQEPLPSTAGDAPSPEGTTPGKVDKDPKTLAQRVAADQLAMLDVRTMVSIVEGCHSGATSYRDCNSHADLGAPSVLGVTIGKDEGEVKISATKNGFRVTASSYSGAKFTVARGPKGDRFKCLPGKRAGACPADRTWSW